MAEAANSGEKLFGAHRMIAALRNGENGTPQDVLRAVLNRDKIEDSMKEPAFQPNEKRVLRCIPAAEIRALSSNGRFPQALFLYQRIFRAFAQTAGS